MFIKTQIPGRFAHAAMLMALNQITYAQQADAVKQLDTVVVTASGFEQMTKDAPASISVITRQDLEKKAFNNLADAVADIEGVSVERGAKTGGMNISIRGMGADYTLILVDGKRVNRNSSGSRPNGFGDVDTSFIPPVSAIERIEVIRGPMSTLYGSDAMGGVINIITRKVAKEWGGTITTDGTLQMNDTFGNNYGSSFYVSGPIKEDILGVSIYGRYSRFMPADQAFPASEAEAVSGIYSGNVSGAGYTGSKIHNLGIQFSLKPSQNHDLVLQAEQGRQRYDNSAQQLGTLNSQVPSGQSGGGYEPEQRFDKTRYALTHLGRYGTLSSDSSVVYEMTETTGRTNPLSLPRLSTDGTPRDLSYDNLALDSKWNWSLLDDTHNLTFGGQWREQKFADGLISAPLDLQQWQWAVFVEDEWRLVESFALTFGARYDRNEQFGGNWSPRAYAVWNLTPGWTLKGGIARGYKTPDLNLMTDGIIGLRGQGTIPVVGSSTLVPEKSTSSELGLYFDDLQGTKANITFFHTAFDDKLNTYNVPNCRAANVPGCLDLGDWRRGRVPVASFVAQENADKATLRGVEVGAAMPLMDGLVASGNYTFTDAKRGSGTSIGQPLNSDARHRLNLRLDWRVNAQTSAWLRAEYRAKEFAQINASGKQAFYNPFWLFGVGGSYKVNKYVALNASIENLFDKKFVNYGTYTTTGASGWGNAYYKIQEGRRFWLSATASF